MAAVAFTNNQNQKIAIPEYNTQMVAMPNVLPEVIVQGQVNLHIQETLDAINSQNETTKIQDEATAAAQQNNRDAQKALVAWDPRLHRVDSFYMREGESDAPVVVPFASQTAATSFYDLVFKLPAAVFNDVEKQMNATPDDNNNERSESWDNSAAARDEQMRAKKAIKNPYGYDLESDPDMYGVASMMNPYTLTKLIGGVSGITTTDSKLTEINNNYMYDIRDQRRFYGSSVDSKNDFLSISNPSVTNIIKWANKDPWGRTPYSFQDFVYNKFFGIVPNNRLLTLRRYMAPTFDNLQFEQMYGEWNDNQNFVANSKALPFAPRCTVVTYFGENTGNNLDELMHFMTGINWTEAKSQIHEVSGSEGDDPQARIDAMFENGNGFYGADNKFIGDLIHKGNLVTSKILSFGKFATVLTHDVGLSQGAFDKVTSANIDPYAEGTFQNRIQGPLDRIDTIKRRAEGIQFDQSFVVRVTYQAKAIGGINPKAALLDILGNCMEMVSPTAVFWGGGHRFMVKPRVYPYHDNGWRDSMMKKLYDGQIFGNNGYIATVFKGLRDFGTNNGQETTAEGIWSNVTSHFGQFLGEGLGVIGSMISSVASSLFGQAGENFASIFNKAGNALGASDEEQAEAASKAKGMLGHLFSNLNSMWHSKVLEQTAMPELKGMNSLLIGEPIGEWHLTVGNPLNPMMVVGNLICEKMDVKWSNELGPDDFPTEMTVEYTLQHGMPRDKAAIQSMFNRGMGRFYDLPDFIKGGSEFETKVDHYTGGVFFREPYFIHNKTLFNQQLAANGYSGISTFQTVKVDRGSIPSNSGNPNTQLITKFSPLDADQANRTIGKTAFVAGEGIMPVIRSLSTTRRFTS